MYAIYRLHPIHFLIFSIKHDTHRISNVRLQLYRVEGTASWPRVLTRIIDPESILICDQSRYHSSRLCIDNVSFI